MFLPDYFGISIKALVTSFNMADFEKREGLLPLSPILTSCFRQKSSTSALIFFTTCSLQIVGSEIIAICYVG